MGGAITMPDIIQETHQTSTVTMHDRYPEIFAACRKYYDKKPGKKLNILSFGCSTGEECFTLARYFPFATIIGVDVNKDALEECNKKNTYPNVYFMHSSTETITSGAPFDMIFCMSVLCSWGETENRQNISNIYNFSKFQNTVEVLDTVLSKDGLLVIYNSNFRFSDSSIYGRYRVLYDKDIDGSGIVQKFDKNNNMIPKEFQKYMECIFIKEITNED